VTLGTFVIGFWAIGLFANWGLIPKRIAAFTRGHIPTTVTFGLGVAQKLNV
jgi:hypothetical protein